MSKVFWQVSLSLDGFMEGPEGDLRETALFTDDDFEAYADEMLGSIGAMILGRKTYDLFVDHWPTATGWQAEQMNAIPKYVFSRKLKRSDWTNTTLYSELSSETIAEIKNSTNKDIAVFGSSALAASLVKMGVIDEFRMMITPFVIGSGTPAFRSDDVRLGLHLKEIRKGPSGMVSLFYERAENKI
ncbi:MAG: dihydrofolate reductase family protein [Acidobacteria bacterium]|nr:dihydrofolate reductase family protein [Acidobacteriota bacterium]